LGDEDMRFHDIVFREVFQFSSVDSGFGAARPIHTVKLEMSFPLPIFYSQSLGHLQDRLNFEWPIHQFSLAIIMVNYAAKSKYHAESFGENCDWDWESRLSILQFWYHADSQRHSLMGKLWPLPL